MLPVAWSIPAAGALLAQVVPQHAIDCPRSCVFWRVGSSAIYRVQAASGTYFLRLSAANRRPADVTYEAEWLHYLGRQGLPVALPVPRRDGGHVTLVEAPEGPRCAVLFEEAPGGRPSTDERFARDLGRLIDEPLAGGPGAWTAGGPAGPRGRQRTVPGAQPRCAAGLVPIEKGDGAGRLLFCQSASDASATALR